MSNKTSEILKKINKKIDEISENKEVSDILKSEIKELAGMTDSKNMQDELESINFKLEKMEAGNLSLKDSVYDFVSSASKTLESLAKTDSSLNDSEQAEKINSYIKTLEKKIDKLIKKQDIDELNSEIFIDDSQFQKLKSELTFFQNEIEARINENNSGLSESIAQIIVGIKEKILEFQEYYENNSEKIMTDILSDVKQIKSDFSEMYDTVRSIDKQSIYETEKNVKKILDKKDTAEKNILSEIAEVKKITAKSSVLDAKSKETVETLKNELSQLKSNIHTQIREVLSKIVIQDEIKFLCEEAITGIKNTNSETGVLRKYLKELKSDDDRHVEQIEEIKNIILDLSEYEMNENSDKIDIIYENMAMLNSWADSSDKMIKNFNDLHTSFDNLGGYFDDLKDDFSLNTDKIDIIYENLSFINEWVKKLDAFAKNVEAIKAGYDSEANLPAKIEEITNQIALVKEWNKKADALALQVRALSVQISETESTVNSKNLADMKAMFAQMSDDMANMSSRTNKMILESDKTNDSLKEHITNLQSIIGNIGNRTDMTGISELQNKIDDIKFLSAKNSGFGQGLTESFLYLAEWIDYAGNAINAIRNEIDVLKEQQINVNSLSEQQQLTLNNIHQYILELANKQNDIINATENLKIDSQQPVDNVVNEQINIAIQQIAAQQAVNQQILQDIKESIGNLNTSVSQNQENGVSNGNDAYNDIMQALQVIVHLIQQNSPAQVIKEQATEVSSKDESANAEVKKSLDFIAAQLVSINENNSKTDMLAKKLDNVETKISNLEQYMAKLIDYLDEE